MPTPTNLAVGFALVLQVFLKDEFGSLLSSLSTVSFPDLTELNLGIRVELNSEGRNLRLIQAEETGFFPPVFALLC